MTEAKKTNEPNVDNAMIGEFARRALQGQKTADLFGVDDAFIHEAVNRAYNFYVGKSYEQAEVLLRGVVALDITQPYPHLLLGDILLQRDDYDEAIEQLTKAHELDADNAEVLAKLGEAQVRAGHIDAARMTLEAALDRLSEESPHHKRASSLLEIANRPKPAQQPATEQTVEQA